MIWIGRNMLYRGDNNRVAMGLRVTVKHFQTPFLDPDMWIFPKTASFLAE